MSHVKAFYWNEYSHKLKTRILAQRGRGSIEKSRENLRLVTHAKEGVCKLFLLVSEEDGEIVEAKYLAFGPTALIGAFEVLCELVLRKNYDQAKRISAELMDKHVQTNAKKGAFPIEAYSHMNYVLEVLDEAVKLCEGISLPNGYVSTPVAWLDLDEGEYPDWNALSDVEKLSTIRAVIEKDVQPYIELDDGGVKITHLKSDTNVVIEYSGSCTSCYAATGSTLSAIQQILRKKVHPEMVVTPNL